MASVEFVVYVNMKHEECSKLLKRLKDNVDFIRNKQIRLIFKPTETDSVPRMVTHDRKTITGSASIVNYINNYVPPQPTRPAPISSSGAPNLILNIPGIKHYKPSYESHFNPKQFAPDDAPVTDNELSAHTLSLVNSRGTVSQSPGDF